MIKLDSMLKKKIYAALNYFEFEDQGFVRNVYCARYSKDSNNSYLFSKTKERDKPDYDSKESKEQLLIDIFNIKNVTEFRDKYKQAVSGDGNEYRRITTLTSSSLCALLCFYNISINNLKIEDTNYDTVMFEIKNKVFDIKHPSNIDIVLISKESQKILFLESKFSEYLVRSKARNISDKYLDLYKKLGLFDEGYNFKDNNDGTFNLERNNNDFYIDGIKQMISHYIGVCNFINDGKSLDNCLQLNGYKVSLGEILFNAWDNDYDYFSKYSDAYSSLIKKLKMNNNQIEFLEKPLNYLEVFKDYPLDDKVKKFYFSK